MLERKSTSYVLRAPPPVLAAAPPPPNGTSALAELVRQLADHQAQVAARLDAVIALLAQAGGAPYLAPLPRARGRYGLPNVQYAELPAPTTPAVFAKADPSRRRMLIYSLISANICLGLSANIAAASNRGIVLSPGATGWLIVSEETWGDLVRQPWYSTSGTTGNVMAVVTETIT